MSGRLGIPGRRIVCATLKPEAFGDKLIWNFEKCHRGASDVAGDIRA